MQLILALLSSFALGQVIEDGATGPLSYPSTGFPPVNIANGLYTGGTASIVHADSDGSWAGIRFEPDESFFVTRVRATVAVGQTPTYDCTRNHPMPVYLFKEPYQTTPSSQPYLLGAGTIASARNPGPEELQVIEATISPAVWVNAGENLFVAIQFNSNELDEGPCLALSDLDTSDPIDTDFWTSNQYTPWSWTDFASQGSDQNLLVSIHGWDL